MQYETLLSYMAILYKKKIYVSNMVHKVLKINMSIIKKSTFRNLKSQQRIILTNELRKFSLNL